MDAGALLTGARFITTSCPVCVEASLCREDEELVGVLHSIAKGKEDVLTVRVEQLEGVPHIAIGQSCRSTWNNSELIYLLAWCLPQSFSVVAHPWWCYTCSLTSESCPEPL